MPTIGRRDLPVNRGRFNFDEIRFDYFREGSVMFDAFKAGQVDLWPEDDPRRWANGYDFPAHPRRARRQARVRRSACRPA